MATPPPYLNLRVHFRELIEEAIREKPIHYRSIRLDLSEFKEWPEAEDVLNVLAEEYRKADWKEVKVTTEVRTDFVMFKKQRMAQVLKLVMSY